MPSIKALLLMAGSGARFKSSLPKQFHRIGGKKIYLHTLERFLSSSLFDEILLVCSEEWKEEVEADVAAYKEVRVVSGGKTRQDSSYLGLLACGIDTDYVVIHDAVRPFVSARILKENVEAVLEHSAVDTCIPSADTLVYSPSGKEIAAIPTRSHYLRGQTPQSFSYPLILRAHENAIQKKITASDDCSLVLAEQKQVFIVKGEEENIKITSELDLFIGEQLLRLHTHTLAPSQGEKPVSLKGKTFVLTGGTGEIGQAIALRLKEEGAIPILLSKSADPFAVDLTSFLETKQMFDKLFALYGPIDGLINCIGKLKRKPLEDLTSQEIQELIDVNLTGVVFACRCAKIKERGNLINIASSAYSRGRKEFALYSAAKAAVVNFTQALSEERPDLCVTVVAPQRTDTRMRREQFPQEDQKELLTSGEVADVILKLLKEKGPTGALVDVRNYFVSNGAGWI